VDIISQTLDKGSPDAAALLLGVPDINPDGRQHYTSSQPNLEDGTLGDRLQQEEQRAINILKTPRSPVVPVSVKICRDSLHDSCRTLELGQLELDSHAQAILFMAQSQTQGRDRVTPLESSCRKLYRKQLKNSRWTQDGLQWTLVAETTRLGQLPQQEILEVYLVERPMHFVLAVVGQEFNAEAQYKPDKGVILDLRDDLDDTISASISEYHMDGFVCQHHYRVGGERKDTLGVCGGLTPLGISAFDSEICAVVCYG